MGNHLKKWHCDRKGHTPNPYAPENWTKFGDTLHVGLVCLKCGCVYFEPRPFVEESLIERI